MELIKLVEEISEKGAEARSLLDANKLAEAKKAFEEVKELQEKRAILEGLEQEELRNLQNQKKGKNNKQTEKVDEMRSIVKYLLKEDMTDEERAIVKTTDNAAVIPKQFINEIEKIKKGFASLKPLVHVIPVTKMEGTIPIIDLDQNTLSEIGEGQNIIDGALKTKEIKYKCKKVGLKQTLTSELVEDAEVEIEGLCKENFLNIATIKENYDILKIIKENATKFELEDQEKILDAEGVEIENPTYEKVAYMIDKALPGYKLGLKTVTNLKGYCYLKNLKDKNGVPLNLITEKNGKEYYNSKEIVIVDDELLPEKTPGKKIFYSLNIVEAIKFLDRKKMTLETWREPKNDTNNISILERYDVQPGSKRSVRYVEI